MTPQTYGRTIAIHDRRSGEEAQSFGGSTKLAVGWFRQFLRAHGDSSEPASLRERMIGMSTRSVSVECSRCGASFSADRVLTVCEKCDGALLFQYDLARAAEQVSKEVLRKRDDSFWKFAEMLPLSSPDSIVSLGELYTPVLRLSRSFGVKSEFIYAKDEGRLPTGTFKARGMAVAVSKLKELGVTSIAIPSAGNAGAALGAYGARAGMDVHVFMPKDVPEANLRECVALGARVYIVDGLIDDAAAILRRCGLKHGWFEASTNKQPYRFEGYKAMAFEIAEQFNWNLPDNIFFPTGGGEGVIGLWKGFGELMELNLTEEIPRIIAVQSSGCAPLVAAYERNETEVTKRWEKASTIAGGLRVPMPYASYLILRALKETRGSAVAVHDSEILSSMKTLLRKGIYACPEAASALAALRKLEDEDAIDSEERSLLCLTGTALKHLDLMKPEKDKIPILSKDTPALL